MDKETLSNYGWIVICVLVLAVMIALAGPFGNFIANAVKSTTQGLFDTNQNALDVAGIEIEEQTFWEAQNGARAYYDRVYATDDGRTAGIWHRDGSGTIYTRSAGIHYISASEIVISGNRITVPDPYCPGTELYYDVNSDGSVVSASMWYYSDFDAETRTYASKEFSRMEDVPITDYTTIEDWLAAE